MTNLCDLCRKPRLLSRSYDTDRWLCAMCLAKEADDRRAADLWNAAVQRCRTQEGE